MRKLWYNLLLLIGISAIVAPVAVSEPINPYVLTAAKIASALGYTPATNALASGKLFIGSSGGAATAQSLSQDCTVIASGVITCTKSNNVSFGTNAFTSTAYAPLTSPTFITGATVPGGVTTTTGGNYVAGITCYNDANFGCLTRLLTNGGSAGAAWGVRKSDDSGYFINVSNTAVVNTYAPIVTFGYTVSTLPSASANGMVVGAVAYVTDQLTTCAIAGAALTGGGSKICPVFYNGTAWVGN